MLSIFKTAQKKGTFFCSKRRRKKVLKIFKKVLDVCKIVDYVLHCYGDVAELV